jgi:hydroxypyruvate isomerase
LWQPTADERSRDIDLLVGQLRGLAHYAGEHGVVLCIEPLNRFETSLINLAEQAIEILDRVDHAACGLLLDTFHMNIESDRLARLFEQQGRGCATCTRARTIVARREPAISRGERWPTRAARSATPDPL